MALVLILKLLKVFDFHENINVSVIGLVTTATA